MDIEGADEGVESGKWTRLSSFGSFQETWPESGRLC